MSLTVAIYNLSLFTIGISSMWLPAFPDDSCDDPGSQLSIETALRNGRYMGARCVRLQLRDLVYAHRRRSVDDDDTSYSVPLQILLPRHAGGHVRTTLGSLGKRRLHHTSRSPRCKRMNHKMYCGRRKRLRYLPPSVSSVLDPPLNLLLNAKSLDSTVHPSQVMAYEVLKSTSPHSLPDVINAVTSRRTHNNLLRRHAAPLDECFLSCAADRYRASVVGDPFVLFQDAAHMANLIDPLSKFSVTTESETPGPSTTAKRFRFDVPLGPSVTEVPQQPTTSSSN
ncbi:unnamed protein product [Dicrocoelium dendriticum]|nr:unnamed protein product [Dicrocoelium dendriticum]